MKILSYTFELNPRSMLYPRLKGNKNFRHKQHFVSFFLPKSKESFIQTRLSAVFPFSAFMPDPGQMTAVRHSQHPVPSTYPLLPHRTSRKSAAVPH